MSKNKKNKNKDLQNEEINNNDQIVKETALEQIEPELEETESYKKASFGEKISLKFRKRLIASRFHTLILILLLVAVIWGINIWAESKKGVQIDLTKNKLYSITNVTKDQLKNLDKDVLIYVYGFDESSEYVEFLDQYKNFNKKINYQIIDETNNYDIVSKYNLGQYSTIIVTCGEKDKIIYPEYEFFETDQVTGEEVNIAEEAITNAILKVSIDDPIKVYFAIGTGGYSKDTLSYLSSELENQVYELEDLNLLTITEIPSDCDILALLGLENDITEPQSELIKNYVNNGGDLLVCSLVPNDGTEFTNLQSVLDLYGAKLNKGILYEQDSNHRLSLGSYGVEPSYLIPGYSLYNPITSKFQDGNSQKMVVMPISQSITVSEVSDENVNVTESEILSTSSKCYNITDYSNGITESSFDGLEPNTFTVATELTRTLTNGENEVESKLVIYGNDSFITDQMLYNFGGLGNFDLITNTFAELAGEEDLITVKKVTNNTIFQKTETQDRITKLIIFGVPVILILSGIIIWTYRKRKR